MIWRQKVFMNGPMVPRCLGLTGMSANLMKGKQRKVACIWVWNVEKKVGCTGVIRIARRNMLSCVDMTLVSATNFCETGCENKRGGRGLYMCETVTYNVFAHFIRNSLPLSLENCSIFHLMKLMKLRDILSERKTLITLHCIALHYWIELQI